jgi:cell division protein FtsQ
VTPSGPNGSGDGGKRQSGIDPRIRQRRVAIARRQGRRRLRIVVAVAIIVVVVAGGLGLLHTGWFSAKKVEVTGSHPHTPTATILSVAGLAGHPPLISVNSGAVAAKLERLPWIASARVSRNWPDHVTIAVTERVAVASLAGPGTSWSEVDRTGRTVEVDATRVAGLVDVAVSDARGPVPPAPLGATTAPAALPALEVARTLPPAFSAQVTQVIGAPDGTVNLALNSGLTVLLGTDDHLHHKYEDIAAIISGAPLHGAKTIDVTVPQSPTVSPS